MELKAKIDKDKLPVHVAVIMDGNGRWAKKKGNQRIFGHKNGIAAVRETVEAAAEIGVKYLTLYAFSTENWNRPKAEVTALMALLISSLNSEVATLNKNNVRLLSIGDIESMPSTVAQQLRQSIEATASNTGLTLILALSYSGRWELTRAAKLMANDICVGNLKPEDITESTMSKYLQTSQIPDPELLIRTSGEYRVSNFLLWQIAYCELFFTETLWPDFRKDDFLKAVIDFQGRERRFGKTSEQMIEEKNK